MGGAGCWGAQVLQGCVCGVVVVHYGRPPLLRVGLAEKSENLRVFQVYWRPQLILKSIQLFKTEHQE